MRNVANEDATSTISERVEVLRRLLVTAQEAPVSGPSAAEITVQNKVRARALLLLEQRARSRHELCQRLQKIGFPLDAIEQVLDDFSHSGLIDDAAFAREWVRQRHERRGKSRSVLDRELRDHGVAAEDRRAALAQLSDDTERATAGELAAKKARSSVKQVPADRREHDKALRRILGVLARRGFPHEMSMAAARTALADRIMELSVQ